MNSCRSRALIFFRGTRFATSRSPSLRHHLTKELRTPEIVTYQSLRFASSVRRSRVGQRSGGETAHLVPTAVRDPSLFREAADKLLLKLEAALRPMEKHNDVFIITLTPRDENNNASLSLQLKPEDGSYRVEVNDDARQVSLTSAVSGSFNYVLSASTGEWVEEKDGHSLEGMLVRDLIRQCNGLPNL